MSEPQSQVQRLREIMARLRAPGGCPWDREQTHRTLQPYLIEEACELLDAIDRDDFPHMCEELGDVLLQVVFHAQLAEEAGHFDLEAVAQSISDKLIRRHPHVFGDARADTSDEVLHRWEQIKRAEKIEKGQVAHDEPDPLVKHLPPALPALLRALDVYKQLAKKKALPSSDGLVDAAAVSRLADGLNEDEAGRRLFELTAACRHAGVDPESALRRHAARVIAAAEAEHGHGGAPAKT